MNLGRVATEDLARGQVVTRPGTIRPTLLVDARLEVLRDVPRPLEHNMAVELYVGAARVEASLRLLDADALGPGESGLVQLRLAAPLVAARGDRYIVRLASPSMTLGGGEILNAHPRPTPPALIRGDRLAGCWRPASSRDLAHLGPAGRRCWYPKWWR